jgi:hypothetical protein
MVSVVILMEDFDGDTQGVFRDQGVVIGLRTFPRHPVSLILWAPNP